jgi:xylulokinase
VSGAALLGVDVGTTGVRAAVFDELGRAMAHATEGCPHAIPAPGFAEGDAEVWWRAVGKVVARLGRETPLARVDAIGVTGQAPTLIPIDSEGTAIRSAILWLDVRARGQARRIDALLGPGRAESIGGNRMHAYYLGPKLAWLRENEPEVLDRCALVLQCHAFIVFRLTGEARCDPSTAMLCAPLFHAKSRTWSEEGAAAVGVPTRLLPAIVRAQDVVGVVTREAAMATGLREGTPVVAGGGDFAAATLSAGVIEEGEACLMLGTAGNLLMPRREPCFDTRLVNSHHVGCDSWLSLGATICGAALEWFRVKCAGGVGWEELEADALAVESAAIDRLIFVPSFQGERTPIWDEEARGIISGIDLAHGRGHLYRALVEGVALGFRHCLVVAQQGGATFDEVVAANGAGTSGLLRQSLADALGLPLTWRGGSPEAGGTVAGAALLGGIGTGVLKGPEVARAWRGPGIRHTPDPRANERLSEVFERRLALYDGVRKAYGVR